jgi:predicted acyltransferase
MKKTVEKSQARLRSLDVMRGITIAGMILVNNPGNWGFIYTPLEHTAWNGLTPTDLVFPFFMFIMGVSIYLSYKKFDFHLTRETFLKLLRRSVLLFLIGLAINWLSLFMVQLLALHKTNLPILQRAWMAISDIEQLRILGVLQRLALVSFFGSLIVLCVKPKRIPWIIGFILLVYWLLMAFSGSFFENDTNLVFIVDKAIFGITHLYTDHLHNGTSVVFDPEGFLSTLPGIAHVLLGFWAGKFITETKNHEEKTQKLFIFGTILIFLGFFVQYGFPINKKIWSTSFALVSCGLGSLLLALLIWIIDIKHHQKWSVFFESFGVNPLFIYVVADLMSIFLVFTGFDYFGKWTSFKAFAFDHWILPVFGNYFGSLVYAIIFVLINWLISNILYKRKIFIKL